MNFYLLSIIGFCVLIAILYLKSSEHQRLIYTQKYIRDNVSGTLGFEKFKETAVKIIKTSDKPMVLIHLDINGYHEIIDSYGCETAENVLHILGNELNKRSSRGYISTRQSGDKFFCLMPFHDKDFHVYGFDIITEIVESEVKRICSIPIKIRGNICIVDKEESLENMMLRLSNLLNEKTLLTHQRNFFYVNDIETSKQWADLADEVSESLLRGEFSAFFQPQYNIYTNEVVGAETLLRWEHPTKGIIMPEILIPMLESYGYLTKVEKIVFEEACRFIGLRLALGLQVFPVSCNFSLEHFNDENFTDTLSQIAQKHNVPHKFLVIELTESLLAEDVALAACQVEKIKNQGFKIAVDNFGSGYLSLKILSDINVDILKIDRCMIAACDNDKDIKIIKGMATIAKDLGLAVICEGVETEAQVAIMKSVFCNLAQGFYYCPPLNMQQFEELLQASKIEIVNNERLSINGYGRTLPLPSYADLGDLFSQMYDFAFEVNLKDGRYFKMAFNPIGNIFIPYSGEYEYDYQHIITELVYPKDIEKLVSQISLEKLREHYQNIPEYSGCECRLVGVDGVIQWYSIRVYYWFGRSKVLITARNINDTQEYLDADYEKVICKIAGI